MSSWLLLNQSFKDHVPEQNLNQQTPILMGHGDMDPIVLYSLATDSQSALKGMGYDVTLKTYKYVNKQPPHDHERIA